MVSSPTWPFGKLAVVGSSPTGPRDQVGHGDWITSRSPKMPSSQNKTKLLYMSTWLFHSSPSLHPHRSPRNPCFPSIAPPKKTEDNWPPGFKDSNSISVSFNFSQSARWSVGKRDAIHARSSLCQTPCQRFVGWTFGFFWCFSPFWNLRISNSFWIRTASNLLNKNCEPTNLCFVSKTKKTWGTKKNSSRCTQIVWFSTY